MSIPTYMSTVGKLTKICFNKRLASNFCSVHCMEKRLLQNYKGTYLFLSHLQVFSLKTLIFFFSFFWKGIVLCSRRQHTLSLLSAILTNASRSFIATHVMHCFDSLIYTASVSHSLYFVEVLPILPPATHRHTAFPIIYYFQNFSTIEWLMSCPLFRKEKKKSYAEHVSFLLLAS